MRIDIEKDKISKLRLEQEVREGQAKYRRDN